MIYSDSHVHFTKINTIEGLSSNMRINCVTNTAKEYRLANKLYNSMKHITVSVGYHPLYYTKSTKELEDYLTIMEKQRFIGEIGLDIKSILDLNYQKEVLREIIRTANLSKAKVISLHNRETFRESTDIISDFQGITIFHRFNGNAQDCDFVLNNPKWYVSINPLLVSDNEWNIIKNIPRKQLLLETDAPFTLKGTSTYDINYIIFLYNLMAKKLVMKVEDLIEQIDSNFSFVFESKGVEN